MPKNSLETPMKVYQDAIITITWQRRPPPRITEQSNVWHLASSLVHALLAKGTGDLTPSTGQKALESDSNP